MNPVVLIATHKRVEITKLNIVSLMMQSVQPKIVLGVTDQNEANLYKNEFPEIDTYIASNSPLGFKWQMGVHRARAYNPDPLIILGSDDILGIDFIENACHLLRSYDFVGLKSWYVVHQSILYHYNYLSNIPLGGGRCYSGKLLNLIGYKLFDQSKERHLDDYGWRQTKGFKSYISKDIRKDGLNLVSIKGNWEMMNPFSKFNSSPNVELVSKSRDMEEVNQLISVWADLRL